MMFDNVEEQAKQSNSNMKKMEGIEPSKSASVIKAEQYDRFLLNLPKGTKKEVLDLYCVNHDIKSTSKFILACIKYAKNDIENGIAEFSYETGSLTIEKL